jgi:hypothetical protein
MTGIERRKYEMLVRVRNFGETNRALFESSPVAQQTFLVVGAAIDDLGAADMRKMAASASARADRRETARKALRELLQNVAQLARTLRAEGRTLPAFDLPRSKSAVTLLTAGRQFAVDVKPFDADFAGHGMGAAQIASTTSAFEQAMNTQGTSRGEHVAARAHIRGSVAAAIRSVRRLDLIVANDLRDNHVIQALIQAQWKQLRRLEDPRTSRGDSGGDIESPATAPVSPVALSSTIDAPPPAMGTDTPAPPAA